MKHLFVGIVLLGLGIWGIVSWWSVFGLVMRGVVPFALILVGLVAVIAGYRRGLVEERGITEEQHPATHAQRRGGNGRGLDTGLDPFAADPRRAEPLSGLGAEPNP
jgi:hypothetical protein